MYLCSIPTDMSSWSQCKLGIGDSRQFDEIKLTGLLCSIAFTHQPHFTPSKWAKQVKMNKRESRTSRLAGRMM